ncbi:MAG: prolipoprotein diacylglyceryl transferase family protein [Chryseolinea sp.]
MLNFILWDASPMLFSNGTFSVRWYAIFVILGVVAGRQLFSAFNKKDPASESITLSIILFSILGSRLLYVLLNTPAIILKRPWEAILPFQFTKGFHFVGLSNLSGHGAILGVVLACWMARKKIGKDGFFGLLDKALISICLVTLFVSFGLFLNGETEGKSTSSPIGIVTTYPVTEGLRKIPCCIMRTPGGDNPLTSAGARKGDHSGSPGYQPIILYLFYKAGLSEETVKEFIIGDVKEFLFFQKQYVLESGVNPINFSTLVEGGNTYVAKILTQGVSRHPIHAYEVIAFLLIFVLLYRLSKNKNIQKGIMTGVFFLAVGVALMLLSFFREYMHNASLWASVVMSGLFVIAGLSVIASRKKSLASSKK